MRKYSRKRLFSEWKLAGTNRTTEFCWVVSLPELGIFERFDTHAEALRFMEGLALDWRLIQT